MEVKLSEEHKVGLTIAIIILILINLPTIYGFLVKPEKVVPFEIPLCKVSNEVTIDVAKQEKEKYLNVPDYYAKIFITLSKQNYIVNDIADTNVKIQDDGILRLSKPYFYLLVFDPSDKLKEMFPCFINEKEKQFTGGGKWDKWVSPTNVLIGTQYLSCIDKESFYLGPANCIPRYALINGTIGNNLIKYTFKITEPGTWKIYVFLFDEEYKTRQNIHLEKQRDYPYLSNVFQNAIAYGYSEFLVRSEAGLIESSGVGLSNILSEIFKILIAGISYYVVSREKIYPKLKDIYKKHISKLKFELLGLFGFLVLITLYLLVMFKFLL